MSSWSLASAVSPNVTNSGSDVIRLNNLKSSSETNLPSRGSVSGLPRPTTPVPGRKLASKRPPHLTLNIGASKSQHKSAPMAETENTVLSASSSIYETPLSATPASVTATSSPARASQNSQDSHKSQGSHRSQQSSHSTTSGGSVFPHEQYKAIKKINIGFENIRHTTKFGILKRGELKFLA